jgi:putative two-component system response regulator
MAAILRLEGYAVRSAGDGKESLDLLLAGTPPDLILLDMLAPGFDGWRFLEQRKRNPGVAEAPVIIITGLNIASPDWAHSLGAAGFLRKPVDVPLLLEEIKRALKAESAVEDRPDLE